MRRGWNIWDDLTDAADDLIEAPWIDPGVIDLVVWFPHLTWQQFLCACVAVLTWSWISEQLRRLAVYWLRRHLSALLFKVAEIIAPADTAQRHPPAQLQK